MIFRVYFKLTCLCILKSNLLKLIFLYLIFSFFFLVDIESIRCRQLFDVISLKNKPEGQRL